MTMPGRNFNAGFYRYGFNGMEKDDEVKGSGNHVDFGARGYDPRLGRWLSVDPLVSDYPEYSPYAFVANSPIIAFDPDGKRIEFANQESRENFRMALSQVFGQSDVPNNIGEKLYEINNLYAAKLEVMTPEKYARFVKKELKGVEDRVLREQLTLLANDLYAAATSDNVNYVDITTNTQWDPGETVVNAPPNPEETYKIEKGNGTGNYNEYDISGIDINQTTNVVVFPENKTGLIITQAPDSRLTVNESNSVLNGVVLSDQTLTSSQEEE